MAATTPFEVVTASASGLGVNFQVTTTSQSATITSKYAPSLLVSFGVPLIGSQQPPMCYVRMSPEASPTATINDIPIAPNTVTVFANPVPNGACGIAVVVSVSSSTLPAIVCVTPGEGGI